MFITYKLGMLLGLSIIISIGAQNLFVIQQALRDEYTYTSALVCFICDFLLIAAGALGVSAIFLNFPALKMAILVLGIIFLLWYGAKAIKRGFAGNQINETTRLDDDESNVSITRIILLGLSFSLLNPAAILDTVIIIGGSANHYAEAEKILFVAGAISASFLWFFGLAAITQYFSRKMISNLIWRTLDLISGGLMLSIAVNFLCQIIQ